MLREKLSALSLSCFARKAGDLPSLANPARRMRLAHGLHAPSYVLAVSLSSLMASSRPTIYC
jgi:hypothetical protein